MTSNANVAASMALDQADVMHPVFLRAQQEIDALVAVVQSVSIDDEQIGEVGTPELEELIAQSCYGAEDGEVVCAPKKMSDRALMDTLNTGVRRMGHSLAAMRTSPIYIGLPHDFYWGQLRMRSTETDYMTRAFVWEEGRVSILRRTRFIIHCLVCQFRGSRPNLT